MTLLPTRIYRDSLWPIAAVIAIPLACLPVRAPTVTKAAVAALNATDAALTTAVAVASESQLPVLEGYIVKWERAAEAFRQRQDLCPHIAGLTAVSKAVSCSECVRLFEVAQKELGCP